MAQEILRQETTRTNNSWILYRVGLFATQDISKDTVLFTEFPFIYFPPMKRYNMAVKGEACGLCARSIKGRGLLSCGCPKCGWIKYCTLGNTTDRSTSRTGAQCLMCHFEIINSFFFFFFFVSLACRDTAWDSSHKFECPALNPALKDYINLCVRENWNAGMGALRCYERILIANEESPEELDTVLKHLDAFATVNQEERQKKDSSWDMMGSESQMIMWEEALKYLIKGCRFPLKVTAKDTPNVLKKALPEELSKDLFSLDTFLKFVGRYNINNQDGGLYLLHSSLNHACVPNVIIDHPGAGTNYGVSVRLARDIKRDEQLQITYCDPRWGRETRQQYLKTEYLFTCRCKRCTGTDDGLSEEIKQALGVSF